MKRQHPSSLIRRGLLGMAVMALLLVSTAGVATAANKLDEEIGELCKDVCKYLQTRNIDQIAVGAFTGPAEATAGPRLKKTLTEKLEASNIEIKKRGFSISGDYSAMTENGRLLAVINAKLKDRLGRQVFQLKRRVVSDEEEVAQIFGLTFDKTAPPVAADSNPPKAEAKPGAKAKVEAIEKSFTDPRVHIVGQTKVFPSPGSDYGIEILVKGPGGYEARTCAPEDGLAFVELAHDEIYAIRVYNNSDYDAAVAISIDGINMFAFSPIPEFRSLGKMVIGRHSSAIIRGWYYTNERSREFKITDYGDSAAGQLGGTQDLGTITAIFCAAWDPAREPPPPGESGLRRNGKLTGFGADVDSRTRTVFRQFGSIRASVSIRYDKDDLPPASLPK